MEEGGKIILEKENNLNNKIIKNEEKLENNNNNIDLKLDYDEIKMRDELDESINKRKNLIENHKLYIYIYLVVPYIEAIHRYILNFISYPFDIFILIILGYYLAKIFSIFFCKKSILI